MEVCLHFELLRMTTSRNRPGRVSGNMQRRKFPTSLPLDTGHFGSESQSPNRVRRKSTWEKEKQKIGLLWGICLISKHIKNDESQVSHCPKGRYKYDLREKKTVNNWIYNWNWIYLCKLMNFHIYNRCNSTHTYASTYVPWLCPLGSTAANPSTAIHFNYHSPLKGTRTL